MLYKPNFCCNCGERVERVDWTVLTSRRFCDVCSVENKRHDRFPQALVAGGVLALMFGLGSFFGGKEQASPAQTLNSSPALLRSEPTAAKPIEQVPPNPQPAAAPAAIPAVPQTKPSPAGELETVAKAYYCGALTKKGTPCSRKVKSAEVRCFQHLGKPAAVPGG